MTQMGHQNDPLVDSRSLDWCETGAAAPNPSELARLNAARAKAAEETASAIARELNGPLTALLLYMNEIKQHQFAETPSNRVYLQQVVENAVQQLERVCTVVKQMSDKHGSCAAETAREPGRESQAGRDGDGDRLPGVTFASEPGQKPLTRREREVLSLISEGCSNKQGALRMNISPRTFESHRAEAMRKLGARNTADLVRKALLQPA